MRVFVITVLVLLFLAAPVSAYYLNHEFEIKLDGEWEFKNTYTDGVVESTMSLAGVGLAEIYSRMEISPVSEADMLWWNLF